MKTPPVAATNPSPTFRTRGVIEGFYGRPYSWDERATLVRFIGARDMNTYVYAPKDDPLHRAQWRDLYARADIEGFVRLARIASACGVRFVYAIAPGLSYAASDPSEFARLAGKIGQLLDAGVHGIALLFDDLTADSSALNPVVQADLVAQVRELLPAGPCRDAFWFIGNHYAGRGRDLEAGRVAFPGLYPGHPRDWFDAYAERVPAEVPVGWTGPAVFSARLDAGDAAEFCRFARRPVLVWDNFPVNDALLRSSLFLGPYLGRDPRLVDEVDGILANLMLQPSAQRIALATVADFLRDPLAYDPESSHAQAVEEVGAAGADALRVFVDHHRSHPVLAPRADAATLHELAGRALGATPEAGARGALRAHLDGIVAAMEQLPGSLPDAETWEEIEPWAAKLGSLARAALAGLDAVEGSGPADAFVLLRDVAQALPQSVARTTLPEQLFAWRMQGAPPGEAFAFFDGITPADGVDRFSDLFEEISGALRVRA